MARFMLQNLTSACLNINCATIQPNIWWLQRWWDLSNAKTFDQYLHQQKTFWPLFFVQVFSQSYENSESVQELNGVDKISGIGLAADFIGRSNLVSLIYIIKTCSGIQEVRKEPIERNTWTHLTPLLVSHKKKINFGHFFSSPVKLQQPKRIGIWILYHILVISLLYRFYTVILKALFDFNVIRAQETRDLSLISYKMSKMRFSRPSECSKTKWYSLEQLVEPTQKLAIQQQHLTHDFVKCYYCL